ncbi:MAG: hypothetical protein U0974_11935 [Gemmatimonadales bacterium]|nr:hypothetical protein [Gemmatimonadales bacterium]
MPQNFMTRSVHLRQAHYERIKTFPSYTAPGKEGLVGSSDYHVVTVRLTDGREFVGLLVSNGDTLMVPASEPHWGASDIAEILPTPAEQHPDFTITEPKALEENRCIEMGNLWRRGLFGPPHHLEDDTDYRALPIHEAHEEALDDDRTIHLYPGDLPATVHGFDDVILTANGVQVTCRPVGAKDRLITTLWPKGPEFWADLLHHELSLAEDFTLGAMLTLLDLPPETDREVYLRTMRYREERPSFQPWVLAGRRGASPKAQADVSDVEALVVGAYADEWDGGHTFYFDAHGMGVPLAADDPETGTPAGECPRYCISYPDVSAFVHLPVRYDPELVIPVSHEERMAFMRGPLFDWREAGEQGPRPEMPVLLRIRRAIKLGEFIAALFGELGVRDPKEDDEEAADECSSTSSAGSRSDEPRGIDPEAPPQRSSGESRFSSADPRGGGVCYDVE